MSTLSDEQCQEAVDAVEKHGGKRTAAKASGIPWETFRHRLKQASLRGFAARCTPVPEGFELSGIATTRDGAGNVISRTERQRLEHGEVYQPPLTHVLGKITVNRDADGRVIQDWARFSPDQSTPHIITAFQSVFEKYKGAAELIEPPERVERDLATVIPIADQHNGLLAWARDTGEDYDLKIGVKRLQSTATKLITRCDPSGLAIILNVGDWQHNDDGRNVTPRSHHHLDVDSRYYKILETGAWLMVNVAGLALRKFKRVIIVNLPGNHDPHAGDALNVALSMFYHNNPRVKLIPPEGKWFFHRFGQTLLGAHHGDRITKQQMAMAMAVRCKEDWGATNYHWVLHGHIHHETEKEIGDVRVESFQTLASKDAYSAGNGYVSGRSLTAITLHREMGEVGRIRENIPPPVRSKMLEEVT